MNGMDSSPLQDTISADNHTLHTRFQNDLKEYGGHTKRQCSQLTALRFHVLKDESTADTFNTRGAKCLKTITGICTVHKIHRAT